MNALGTETERGLWAQSNSLPLKMDQSEIFRGERQVIEDLGHPGPLI